MEQIRDIFDSEHYRKQLRILRRMNRKYRARAGRERHWYLELE